LLPGDFVWAIRMGGAVGIFSGKDYGNSIALDASANVYVMGDQYSNTVDFDPGPDVYNVSNLGREANFIAHYDSSGNFRCAFTITPGHNEASRNHQLAVASSNIYITASFTADTDFDLCPPVYNLPNSGNYDIYVAKYDMSNCNCVPPVANFTASDTMICEGGCINFIDLSTNFPTSWQWSFPGATPSFSTAQDPTNICYNDMGVFDVQLIATNANGTDTLTIDPFIVVNVCDTIRNLLFIPNSFTPNGDGENDILLVRGSGIKSIKLFIYNRWGEKVFQLSVINYQSSIPSTRDGWDGTYKGKKLNTAVFAWFAEVEFGDADNPGNPGLIYQKGNVALVR